jgi:hypothetical protein
VCGMSGAGGQERGLRKGPLGDGWGVGGVSAIHRMHMGLRCAVGDACWGCTTAARIGG